jgi:two-component system, NtrC family, sensor histidine kinase HydH
MIFALQDLRRGPTDRILLEKAAVQRENPRTLSAMAAEAAHEIRNPLVSLG